MPDPASTSSNFRCEQSFSGNSTTSPVSSLEGKQPLLWPFPGERYGADVSHPPGPVRPLLRRADVPGQLLMLFQGQALVAAAASVDGRVGLLQGPRVPHWPSPFCSGVRISQHRALHQARSSPPLPIPLPENADPPVGLAPAPGDRLLPHRCNSDGPPQPTKVHQANGLRIVRLAMRRPGCRSSVSSTSHPASSAEATISAS